MEASEAELTIDQLAQRTGMTVRNVRAHQSRGLLPPPEVRGRTGYYGADHVSRLELIREMQAEGFNLELIKRMIESAGGQTDQVLRFTRTLREPFGDEELEVVTAAELTERFGGDGDPKAIEQAVRLGALRPIGEDSFEMSPTLLRAGTELAELGLPLPGILEVFSRLRRSADSVAKAFIGVFMEVAWHPFDKAGRPEEQWGEVGDAIERLRPLAVEALVAVFKTAMDDAVERTMEELARSSAKPSKRR